MSTMPDRAKMTEEEYLAIERAAETKSEFHDGEMYAMSGANRPHILATGNLFGEIRNQLKGRDCEVYSNDMRVNIKETGSYTYPDVVAVCGERRFAENEIDNLLNPTLIVEVLSPSTEDFDRNLKFDRYSRIASLKEYVLVSQDRMQVDRYRRQDELTGWFFRRFHHPDEVLDLESIGCAVPLSEIYARVELPANQDDAR
jgi:Uma2 family endonuclease